MLNFKKSCRMLRRLHSAGLIIYWLMRKASHPEIVVLLQVMA